MIKLLFLYCRLFLVDEPEETNSGTDRLIPEYDYADVTADLLARSRLSDREDVQAADLSHVSMVRGSSLLVYALIMCYCIGKYFS